jgi:hypothetical protein
MYDGLYDLLVRVLDFRPRDPGFDSRRYQIFRVVSGLERSPLSLVRINGWYLKEKVTPPIYKTEITGRWGLPR